MDSSRSEVLFRLEKGGMLSRTLTWKQPGSRGGETILTLQEGGSERGPHLLSFTNVAYQGEKVGLFLHCHWDVSQAVVYTSQRAIEQGSAYAIISYTARLGSGGWKYSIAVAAVFDVTLAAAATLLLGQILDRKRKRRRNRTNGGSAGFGGGAGGGGGGGGGM